LPRKLWASKEPEINLRRLLGRYGNLPDHSGWGHAIKDHSSKMSLDGGR